MDIKATKKALSLNVRFSDPPSALFKLKTAKLANPLLMLHCTKVYNTLRVEESGENALYKSVQYSEGGTEWRK